MVPRVRAIEGVGLVMIGFFSTDPAPGYPPETLRTVTTVKAPFISLSRYSLLT